MQQALAEELAFARINQQVIQAQAAEEVEESSSEESEASEPGQ